MSPNDDDFLENRIYRKRNDTIRNTVKQMATFSNYFLDVCIVPEVKLATQEPVAEGRVASGQKANVFCNAGYQYGGGSQQELICTKDVTNNFPASCRSKYILRFSGLKSSGRV